MSWLPIDQAPRDGTPVDVWRGEWKERVTNVRFVQLSPDNCFFEPVVSGPTCIRDATYFMYIPSPP